MPAHAAAGTPLTRDARSFDRAHVVNGTLEKVKQANDLAGAVGWFDYDVTIPANGWYELIVRGHATSMETLIDPRGDDPSKAAFYAPFSLGFNGTDDKVTNFWFTRGKHTVRLQHWHWTGANPITGITLRPSDGRPATSMRVIRRDGYGIYRKGECGDLQIEYGPRTSATTMPVYWVDARTSNGIRSFTVALPAVAEVTRVKWPIPCEDEGMFVLYFTNDQPDFRHRDVQPFTYEVIDTHRQPAAGRSLKKTLVQEIDLVAAPPDYRSGETRVVTKAFGAYRESDDHDWFRYQRSGGKSSPPSWFAYALKGLAAQQPHLIEVDYPDDADRTFAIAVRESDPLAYPVAGGVDSGGEFSLSQRMQTQSLLFWPRSTDARIVFLNAQPGKRAAAARVRVYRVEGRLPSLLPNQRSGRDYANWYEEGSNVTAMYGPPNEGPAGTHIALERWAQSLEYMGANVMWPTVVIYTFALYPSIYNRAFSQPWAQDMLRQTLLIAEKHGLKVIPELHPRADELAWPYANAPEPKPELLVSRNGRNWNDLPPYYNPLHPGNQDWYVGMIGELADRYRDSPALQGVSLRFMQWKNPALDNFHSLEWGYDDLTVGMFEKETGIRVPVATQNGGRYAERYRWLMANARERWVAWRCEKIAQLLTRIRDRVRRARPDLKVYLPIFATKENGSSYNTGSAWLREAGFDMRLLSKIDGLVVVNALHTYGRRADDYTNDLLRRYLTDRSALHLLDEPGKQAAFLPTASYFEATEMVATPEQLGFPANTKKTWMAAVVNPAGRNYLERFASILAETDTQLLGDGGNAYTLGQPELREFLDEYRRLPAVPFRPRSDARDPVAVWELERDGGYTFYAVNRTARPATLDLAFQGDGELIRLSKGEPQALQQHALAIELAPFQLIAYRTTRSLRIAAAKAK